MNQPIPNYLRPVEQVGHVYGKVYRMGSHWVIEGEPIVLQMAKRLFPGSAGWGHAAKFPANKRSTADLNWLMQKYPLKIVNPEEWERLYKEAVDHALKRYEISQRPQKMLPPATFIGDLKEYQKEGLAFMYHNERCLIADEQGLGKTAQALAWLAALNAFPSIIVVPAHLQLQWDEEIKKFLAFEALPQKQPSLFEEPPQLESPRIQFIRGLRPYELPEAHLYITHYGLLRGWKNELPEMGFKAVVFDEIQELRHRGTEKYSAASLLAGSVEYCVGLSGTPIYNYGGEIWNILNIIEMHCLGDYDSFTREWGYGHGSDKIVQPELLGEYLRREGLMLRRRKKDVLSELPPKQRIVQYLDIDHGLYGNLIGKAVEIALQYQAEQDVRARGRLMRHAINETRKATGLAKAKAGAAFIASLLDAGEAVIFFAYHHEVWDVYKDLLKKYNPVFITGKETPKEKALAQRMFMEGKTNLAGVSLRSATGWNLQRSGVTEVFVELDWSPSVHTQAEDRGHRIGQDESVLCYYLASHEGTDQDMLEVLGLKAQQFTGIMGDKPETQEDRALAERAAQEHMARVIERLLEKHAAGVKV